MIRGLPTCILAIALRPALAVSRQFLAADADGQAAQPSFEEFVLKHGRSYAEGSPEYVQRKSMFDVRLEKIRRHNARTDRTWTAGVNHLSDSTEAEFRGRLGWRHSQRNGGASLLEVHSEGATPYNPPEVMHWRNLSMAAKDIQDQGECGSCWAVASTQLLSAHYEIAHGRPETFSTQELVACVQNPLKCGGSGGCEGATVELALDWVLYNGIRTESEEPYQGAMTECKRPAFRKTAAEQGKLDEDGRLVKFVQPSQAFLQGGVSGMNSLGLTSFRTLEKNRYEPLVRALVEVGPVGVTVAAADWGEYSSGVFDSCSDHTLNHAVLLMGIGKQEGKQTWLLRNSWGNMWGENGYINLLRSADEEANCGVDYTPKDGVACEGGPSSVKVCGTCGILYDSVIPTFVPKKHGWKPSLVRGVK